MVEQAWTHPGGGNADGSGSEKRVGSRPGEMNLNKATLVPGGKRGGKADSAVKARVDESRKNGSVWARKSHNAQGGGGKHKNEGLRKEELVFNTFY